MMTTFFGVVRDVGAMKLSWIAARRDALPPKLHSAYSSAGLALNTFARWRLHPQSLRIGDEASFTDLRFEVKLAIFATQFGAPNLDLCLRRSAAGMLGIESKLTEFLQPKTAQFSDRYDEACADLAHASWRARYDELRESPTRFSFLDSAQLLKHYLGMKRYLRKCGTDSAAVTLLYLYWEPEDAASWPQLAVHREEVAAFAAGLVDPNVTFRALSYRELWDVWASDNDVHLREHAAALRARYDVRLGPATR